MAQHRLWIVGWAALLLSAPGPSLGAESPAPATDAAASAAVARDAQALAGKIDAYFAARWSAAKGEPSQPADDAEFLRRVSLDLTGRIPRVAEARAFLDDQSPDKRLRLVDRLLASPNYVNHFTNVWRALWMPEANTTFAGRFYVPGFESWLRKQLADNIGYDQMVRGILTVPVGPEAQQRVFNAAGAQGNSPVSFYLAKELKPENLAGSTARLFLGVRLECAQCHDHPFADWKRDQFWSLAAFFAGIQRQQAGEFAIPTRELTDRREITIPGSERVVRARFLDGKEPKWKATAGPRVTLAEWVTAADNPYFARAAANRLWAHFFGTGLTDPVDDMVGSETMAHHPELLDELARQFAAHGFDQKFLMRAITASRTYQLTSAAASNSQPDPHLFARMALKSMTPEQLFDSLVQALYYQEQRGDTRVFALNNNNQPRSQFLEKFANQNDKPAEAQTSILQALALMNGKFITDATSIERSELLAAVCDSPFMDTADRIETLYFATLSRKPRPDEAARLIKYVDNRDPKEDVSGAVAGTLNPVNGPAHKPAAVAKQKDTSQRLADVLWALLNSSEFILNH